MVHEGLDKSQLRQKTEGQGGFTLKCEVCGSERRVFTNRKIKMKLCDIHRWEVGRYGKILDRRKLSDPNKIVKYEDYAEVLLYDKNHKEKDRCKISLKSVDMVSSHKWSVHSAGYVSTNIGENIVLLHRLIKNPPEDMEVDHMNGDRFDCRDENLSVCSGFQNSVNKRISSKNSSGVVGVCYDKSRSKWQMRIEYMSKLRISKRFDSFDEAVKERLINESKYFEEFSPNYMQHTNTIGLNFQSLDDNKNTFIEVDMRGNVLAFDKL